MPMQPAKLVSRCLAIAGCAAVLSLQPLAVTAAPAPAEMVTGLVGRWAGNGQAQFKDGQHEPFKCVVTYLTDKVGSQVKQTIRCNSQRLDLMLVSDWNVKEGSITGTWKETKYELKGTLIGSVDDQGYNLYAENEFANATISVRTSSCQQDVVMKFSKEVDLLTAELKKC